jgi:hypothetical protein
MDKEASQRVKEMEEALNRSYESIRDFRIAIDKFKKERADIEKLSEYYSDSWADDFELSEKGEIDPDMPQGVLSEDSLYNLLSDEYSLGLELLRLATDIIDKD